MPNDRLYGAILISEFLAHLPILAEGAEFYLRCYCSCDSISSFYYDLWLYY
jgi:hypothetical protein